MIDPSQIQGHQMIFPIFRYLNELFRTIGTAGIHKTSAVGFSSRPNLSNPLLLFYRPLLYFYKIYVIQIKLVGTFTT